ncbi:Rho GTPase activation protein [Lactarius deliciosus]|nr:Rho GTPase activation protein [Lactarius deliciosus]
MQPGSSRAPWSTIRIHIGKRSVVQFKLLADAAFNPSTFGEPLDAVFRLQERTYPTQWVPIVLSFLADGVLALGEEMGLDRGSYTLEGVKDPLVPALLFKLWLRELIDPLVPSEMYNDYIAFAGDAEACCAAVERLPTAKRRVMTSANLALVMAPNLLRCGSDSMAIVFNNAQYEQVFVYNLLLHLNCSEIDAQYVPQHGLARSPPPSSGIEITKSPRALLSVVRFAYISLLQLSLRVAGLLLEEGFRAALCGEEPFWL